MKTALITEANKGIGYEVARQLVVWLATMRRKTYRQIPARPCRDSMVR